MKKILAIVATAMALSFAPHGAAHASPKISDLEWRTIHVGETRAEVRHTTNSPGWSKRFYHDSEGSKHVARRYHTPFGSDTQIRINFILLDKWRVTSKRWCVKGDFNGADPSGPQDFSWVCLDRPWI